ncbi:NADPH-dependent FMN reductase [Lederbergia citrea]|uniref:NADPH-dependent FMN reductase n=1 Tax=Lederbergia citrea TaxID=2833581 RepID=UPI001BCA1C0D|nr:NADPH-dependent FMN reductase [Lederbergia citrea]MBS4179558.1 NADPH-dependent FMN reductase [Lederbergia citrea]
MSKIVIISGSPLTPSRTDLVLRHIELFLQKKGFSVAYVSVPDLPAKDLVGARFNSPAIQEVINHIKNADGIIIGSPVYKASYTGVLKSLLDLLPEESFNGLPVLPLMVGGSKAHLLAVEFSLKPLIYNLKGIPTQGIYFVDSLIDKTNPDKPITEVDCEIRLQRQLNELIDAVETRKRSPELVGS